MLTQKTIGKENPCPFCFESLKMNNVVFRRNTGERKTDLYVASFNAHRSNRLAVRDDYNSLDPADMSLPKKIVDKKTKCLSGIKDQEGHPLEERLCPFCHGSLPAFFHERKMKYVSVVGFTNCGKTTYLAALYNQLFINRNIGIRQCFGDDYIIRNAQILGVNANNATSTKTLLGPYIFNIIVNDNTDPNEKKVYSDCDYVIYDIPGEGFNDEDWVKKNAGFIKKSDLIIFIIDPTALQGVRTVSDCLFKVFGSTCTQNVAVIINKVDLITGVQLDVNAIFANHDYSDCPPVNWNEIDMNDSLVERDIISQNPEIGYFVDGIKAVFSAGQSDNVKTFASNLITTVNGKSVLNSKGSEEPFFWLMSKLGLYKKIFISHETDSLSFIKPILKPVMNFFKIPVK